MTPEEFIDKSRERNALDGIPMERPDLAVFSTRPLFLLNDVNRCLDEIGQFNSFDPDGMKEVVESYWADIEWVIVGYDGSPTMSFCMKRPRPTGFVHNLVPDLQDWAADIVHYNSDKIIYAWWD